MSECHDNERERTVFVRLPQQYIGLSSPLHSMARDLHTFDIERRELIIKLISGQDARKWDVQALVAWAHSISDEILKHGEENGGCQQSAESC